MAGDPRFSDGKDADALRTIGEVARALGIKQHVLRYWEQQFPMLKPLKRSGGRRYYRPEDIRMVDMIDRLVNREGYTLKGACQALSGGAVAASAPAMPAPPVQPREQAIRTSVDILPQLRAIRDRLAAALDG
ncbi:MerR family transcriptional regulator [Altererythrobacter sp. CC-YST694]|uniref:MerR family transcriptional regulator n=1 Tax=Altererythrobacter sp. CC-YST694 TaxID=2755038 RepID=UPI001D006985|nr:MerR family transcriptional regulator [Altererythrobacter sp. CC-YST694]MCB5424810.1 MerR family transcriptional regulator [Altererythrobacter sp. CC-YST694]